MVRDVHPRQLREGLHEPGVPAASVLRTIGIAAVGHASSALLLALPLAFFMARVAPRRCRPVLVALVVTPLWASYLVKVYAWRAMLQPETGVVAWFLGSVRLRQPGVRLRSRIVVTLTYLWLPYMILPIYAGLDAPARLDARRLRRPRRAARADVPHRRAAVDLPAIVAGSIFTFSLSLGRLHHRADRRRQGDDAGQRRRDDLRHQPAVRRGVATIPVLIVMRLPVRHPPHRRAGQPLGGHVMHLTRGTRIVLTLCRARRVSAFIYVPLGVILVNSFSVDAA